MKKLLTIVSALALTTAVLNAQAPKAYRMQAESLTPTTTAVVRVAVEKESIKTGPYARFAQKMLNTMAPLSDKNLYSIKEAYIDYIDPDTQLRSVGGMTVEPSTEYASHTMSPSEFQKVPINSQKIGDTSNPEAMAKAAAEMIFKIRAWKLELVTGNAGENVFGAGLQSALDELTRMENEYLSLFLGKTTKSIEIKEFEIIPTEGQTNYIAFRFSPTAGVLPASDLSAEPVVLTLKPELGVEAPRKNTKGTWYRIADYAQATLSNGTVELTSRRIPVYQFGVSIQIPESK